jgi:hypothetical protein
MPWPPAATPQPLSLCAVNRFTTIEFVNYFWGRRDRSSAGEGFINEGNDCRGFSGRPDGYSGWTCHLAVLGRLWRGHSRPAQPHGNSISIVHRVNRRPARHSPAGARSSMARPFPTSPAARQLRSRSCIGSIGDPPGELCCRAGEQGDECSTGKVAYGEDHSRPDGAH